VAKMGEQGKRHKVSVEFDDLSESRHPLLWGVLSFIDR
jgi:hypothetical protein